MNQLKLVNFRCFNKLSHFIRIYKLKKKRKIEERIAKIIEKKILNLKDK